MDAVVEVLKAILALGVIGAVLILVPILFMLVFGLATGIDNRMRR